MASEPSPPELPVDQLDAAGWELRDESVEQVYKLSKIEVLSATAQYEDTRTRRILREATDGEIDHQLRFFAASGLGFSPSLPMGVSPGMFVTKISSEARAEYSDRLQEEGLIDVKRQGDEAVTVGSKSVTLTHFTATNPMNDINEKTIPMDCYIAVWTYDGDVFIVTGGHPSAELGAHFGLDTDSPELTRTRAEYKEDHIDLLTAVR